MNYVFDVDGTLTPSRGIMDEDFKKYFLNFCLEHDVYLVTGSDYPKTEEQVGTDVCHAVREVYNCAGNAVYIKGNLIHKSDFQISQELHSYLINVLKQHHYEPKTGNHIEQRIGLCNFSIVGRNANKAQRAEYSQYDKAAGDRIQILTDINDKFPEVEAVAGGETSIDIYEKGKDKSQVGQILTPYIFFGDSIFPGGNDYSIAQYAARAYSVNTWHETYDILKTLE